jgi:adenylate cyclase class 2
VKTRPEIELKIDADQFDQWLAMMEHLGFRPLPAVRKLRRQFDLAFAQRQFNIAIDDVEQLGHFAEIELLVADQSDLPSARSAVEALGNALGLNRVQPKSYLSQLLSKLGHPYS